MSTKIIDEYSFLISDDEVTMLLPALPGECDGAEFVYNGKNTALLTRNDKIMVLSDITPDVREILNRQKDLMICEVNGKDEIAQAYEVEIQHHSALPDKDSLTADFDNDMDFIRDICGAEIYDEIRAAFGIK